MGRANSKGNEAKSKTKQPSNMLTPRFEQGCWWSVVQHATAREQRRPYWISEQYPDKFWIYAYTQVQAYFSSGNISTAEVHTRTLMQVATKIKDEKEDRQQVVFLSDACSVLQALEGGELPHRMEGIQEVAEERRVALQ